MKSLFRMGTGTKSVTIELPPHIAQLPEIDPVQDLGGLVNSATSFAGKDVQQDACFHVILPGCKVVAVADGISSRAYSQAAAQIAVFSAISYMQFALVNGKRIQEDVIREAFDYAHRAVRTLGPVLSIPEPAGWPATTLILAVETATTFFIGHCGDGGALLTTGDIYLTMNPLFAQTNRATMVEYLGVNRPAIRAAVVSFPKVFPSGQVVLIGTDGLLATGQGRVLERATAIIEEVRKRVAQSDPEEPPDAANILEYWVRGDRVKVDDNCALGLLVSAEAVAWWRRPEAAPGQRSPQSSPYAPPQ